MQRSVAGHYQGGRRLKSGKESWILLLLLVIFIVTGGWYAEYGYESRQDDQLTTYSAGPGGLKALRELALREGFTANRVENPISVQYNNKGLLVMAEPLIRPLTAAERSSLKNWVNHGGNLIVLRALKAKELSQRVGLDNTGIIPGSPTAASDIQISVKKRAQPILSDVSTIHLEGSSRISLSNGRNYSILFGDTFGAAAILQQRGDGKILTITEAMHPANSRLANGDNAVFLINAINELGGANGLSFDEYHQGFGDVESSERTLWSLIGTPARYLAAYILLILLLIIYNANRPFGKLRTILKPEYRPTTEYIASMAGLYRRANAREVAIETLYHHFIRDLTRRLAVPGEADNNTLIGMGERMFHWDSLPLKETLSRCQRIVDGDKISEFDLMRLAHQLQHYRRLAQLD